jgi:hypothetical protein
MWKRCRVIIVIFVYQQLLRRRVADIAHIADGIPVAPTELSAQ